jgi:phosphoribosylformylglycinamidine cyclo-ligase
MSSLNYKKAGVDIVKADRFVDFISALSKKTNRTGNVGGIGSFGAFFRAPMKGMKDPLIVSSTDGVGTKLLVAIAQNKHDTVGIDLVAMSVNDLLCCGAEPLFFLDYFATGGLDLKISQAVMKGIVDGCVQSNCALIGGETAEMPGLYKKGDYDLAGFCVGIVDRNKAITGVNVKPGDTLLGLLSSGLHSNGYSLARKVFTEKELKGAWGKKLLTPTILYVKPLLEVFKKGYAKAVANITGGGFQGNIPRTLPKNVSVAIDRSSWNIPELFNEIQKRGKIKENEMFDTFNMGIGMTVTTDTKNVSATIKLLAKNGIKSVVLGKIVKGKGEVFFN